MADSESLGRVPEQNNDVFITFDDLRGLDDEHALDESYVTPVYIELDDQALPQSKEKLTQSLTSQMTPLVALTEQHSSDVKNNTTQHHEVSGGVRTDKQDNDDDDDRSVLLLCLLGLLNDEMT